MTATIPQAFKLAVQHHQAGRLGEAEALYRQILAVEPGHASARHYLGVIAHQVGRHELAAELIGQAIVLDPNDACFPSNLGMVYAALGRLEEAIASYHRALQLQPNFPAVHYNLGNAFRDLDRREDAIRHYRRAIECKPDYAEAHYNLGNMLKDRGQLDDAIAAYCRAIELKPAYAGAHNNLGVVLKNRGQLDEAMAAYRHAIERAPLRAEAHSNLIYTLHFQPGLEREMIAEEQRRWNEQFGAPLKSSILAHSNDRDPEQRLRIGYVSPDFRDHAAAYFLVPLLEAHDHERFEIFCYSNVIRPDAVTARLSRSTDAWREVGGHSDEQLAERIREDGIDILVDLAMHAAGNRLPAFVRRPAPVQVSWLGYPGSTGVEAIGHRLSDAHIDPVGPEESGSGEQVVRLPDAWCCYEPIAEFPPVGALPAANGRGVTFGSLNKFEKINEALLSCWAGLLRAVPDARLLMICPAGQAQEHTLRQFAERGVAPERVELVAKCPWVEYIGLCERIDVALDTYPCNGMTTTCHALWMGVPVVTRAGHSAVSRAGLSLLETIGLTELVARSEEEYVRIAVELAGDLKRLGELRATLRARMAASPLMDAPRFARNMEAAYRSMWRQWCSGRVL